MLSAADRPIRATGVTLRRRSDDGAMLLERGGRYQQLSAAATAIWQWCDGEHGVDAIARRYRERYGIDGSATIAALLERWYAAGLVAADPSGIIDARASRAAVSVSRTGASVRVAWSIEQWAGLLQSLARRLFALPVLVAFAAISLGGAALAVHAVHGPVPGGALQAVALAIAFVLSVAIHEAGHVLTLSRFGGTARWAGIGWYWCAPIAFVDTSDAHALPRGQRIAVSLGGPVASVVLAGFAAVVASCPLPEPVRSLAWSISIMNYGVSVWNLNPLIELDGYYVLTDLLGRPNLRSDVLRALARRGPSRMEMAYAAGVVAYACIFAAFFLPSIIMQIAHAMRALLIR